MGSPHRLSSYTCSTPPLARDKRRNDLAPARCTPAKTNWQRTHPHTGGNRPPTQTECQRCGGGSLADAGADHSPGSGHPVHQRVHDVGVRDLLLVLRVVPAGLGTDLRLRSAAEWSCFHPVHRRDFFGSAVVYGLSLLLSRESAILRKAIQSTSLR